MTQDDYTALRRRGEQLTVQAAKLVEWIATYNNLALTVEAGILHADIADYTQLVTGEGWLSLIHPDQSAQLPAAQACAQMDEHNA
jgi:hypothetical protein